MGRWRRSSLVVRFAALSLVALTGLGVVLGVELHSMIDRRARAEAERMGVVTTRLVFSTLIAQASLSVEPQPGERPRVEGVPWGPEQDAKLTAMAAALQAASLPEDLVGANAWLADGSLVFSTDPDKMNTRHELEPGVLEAFRGNANTEVVRARNDQESYIRGEGPILEIFAPILLPGTPEPIAVAELALPYSPIEEAVRHDTMWTIGVLAGGLVLLWLVLFRVVWGASRRLHRQSETNRQLALHDQLTGLPNRILLHDRAATALARARRTGKATALLLLDLDRFKEINDTLGHAYGDGLLLGVARRLEEALREGDTAARLSGDEFAVLVTDLDAPEDAPVIAARIQEVLHQSFVVESVTLDVEASVGIAMAPRHGDDVDTLLRCADVAMYAAKTSRSGIEVYDPTRDENTPARLALLGDLRRALDVDDQLSLHFQPKVGMDGRSLIGVEALLRWAHPTRGSVAPSEFIPVAEGTGLIHPLTALTLELAVEQARRWMRSGHEIPVAVNVSTRCLLDLDLPAKTQDILERYGVPARLLRLEITESTLIADPARALTVLNHLSSLGIRLSIDDFGTGFSSMSYLKRLPIDELKVDRSFVTDMTTQAADTAVVRSIVELGHNLGLHVVAEGVEEARTMNALSDLGCDVAQGYLFARPMSAADLDTWMAANDPGASRVAPDDATPVR